MRVPIRKIAPPDWGIAFDATESDLPLQKLPLPQRVCVPLLQHIGTVAQPLVTAGERVKTGQPLAVAAADRLGAAVHAPLSGHVSSVDIQPAPGKTAVLSVTLESDGQDEIWPGCTAHNDPLRLPTSELRRAVIRGGIVGLGGAAFPAGVKLNRGSGVDTLILNGVECEPIIKCDDALIRHETELMLLGAQIMLRILEANRCIIALKQGMHKALNRTREALSGLNDDRFSIALLPPVYPAGGELQLIQLLTGREMPTGGLPWDSGAICQNVATAAAVARLLSTGEPLISRIVTLTGDGVARPGNFLARIGTPVSALVEAAGGYTAQFSEHLIMGGPMMGINLNSDNLPVVKATNCIYAPGTDEIVTRDTALPCIRCGDCATVCPVNLMPQMLLQSRATSDFDRLQQLGLTDCIDCGCCDYVCPSKIPLTRQFIDAKQELWDITFEKRRAIKASNRSSAREVRKQHDAQQLEAELLEQTHDISDNETARQKLQALLERTGADKDKIP